MHAIKLLIFINFIARFAPASLTNIRQARNNFLDTNTGDFKAFFCYQLSCINKLEFLPIASFFNQV
jgi:hypothetical protein